MVAVVILYYKADTLNLIMEINFIKMFS